MNCTKAIWLKFHKKRRQLWLSLRPPLISILPYFLFVVLSRINLHVDYAIASLLVEDWTLVTTRVVSLTGKILTDTRFGFGFSICKLKFRMIADLRFWILSVRLQILRYNWNWIVITSLMKIKMKESVQFSNLNVLCQLNSIQTFWRMSLWTCSLKEHL